jgi:hypothetical protein
MSNKIVCKSFDTRSTGATISISGRVRLFGFHSVGRTTGMKNIEFKNKDRSGEVIASIVTEKNGYWGQYECVYNFGSNGILFPDGLFIDTQNTSLQYISNSSFFYQV